MGLMVYALRFGCLGFKVSGFAAGRSPKPSSPIMQEPD